VADCICTVNADLATHIARTGVTRIGLGDQVEPRASSSLCFEDDPCCRRGGII
jgi:hypothetical protein